MVCIYLNLEMVVIKEMVEIVFNFKLDYVILVLEWWEEVIMEGGLDVVGNLNYLLGVVE